MRLNTRVRGVTIVASLCTGFLFMVIGGNSTGSGPVVDGLKYQLLTGRGIVEAIAIFALVVLPASLPATLVGAYLAGRVVERKNSYPLRIWVGRGVAYGFGLGAIGSATWFWAINALDSAPGTLRVASIMGLLGGAAGIIVGGAVGRYCWSLSLLAARGKSG